MTQDVYRRQPRNNSAIPDVILALLVLNGLVFAGQQFFGPQLSYWFAGWPVSHPNFQPWQVLTYGFMHDTRGLAHIGFNLFALWMFGRDLERIMGPRRFLTYYLTCVVGAALVHLAIGAYLGWTRPMVGASGGVFGVLLAYGMAFPNNRIMLLFPPIPMKAKYFVILFGVFELYLGVTGSAPSVANFAHVGGMLFGFMLIKHWTRRRRRR